MKEWLKQIECWKKQHPYPFSHTVRKNITPARRNSCAYKVSGGKVLITTGVGQHQMWTPQNFTFDKPRQFISSMGRHDGTALTAIGVKVANPKSTVVDIDGDGSFQMNIQEMATAVAEKSDKVMLLNNQFLGMVMQWRICSTEEYAEIQFFR
ncbi:MAG: thiamine pyrophosphate-dependent enzyme [Bacilli bacterium]